MRAARRVPLADANERVPYVTTVVGENAGQIAKDLQDQIYKAWPFDTPPGRPAPIDGFDKTEAEDQWGIQTVYTYRLPGEDPIDVRMFSFRSLAKARKEKPGG
jgi:hypothetical protein